MKKSVKFSPEVQERAVRMVVEARGQHDSQWAAIESIAGKIGCTAETLRRWVRQHERDSGQREGMTSAEAQRIKELEREVRELARPTRSSNWPARFSPRRSSTASGERTCRSMAQTRSGGNSTAKTMWWPAARSSG